MPLGIETGTALLAGGAISGLSSLFGAFTGAGAATQAAKIQADALNQATKLQQNIFDITQKNLSPYLTRGDWAANILSSEIGISPESQTAGGPAGAPLTAMTPTFFPGPQISPNLPVAPTINPFSPTGGLGTTFSPTQESLEKFPGYQFARDQGLLAVQGQYGGSQPGGAQLKAEESFASGLASQTEQQAYQQWLGQIQQQLAQYTTSGSLGLQAGGLGLSTAQTGFQDIFGQEQQGFQQFLSGTQLNLAQKQQIYNMLAGQAGAGLSATGTGATTGVGFGQNIGSSLAAGGAAQAGGVIGAANAITGGVANLGAGVNQTALMLALSNAGFFGSPGTAPSTEIPFGTYG